MKNVFFPAAAILCSLASSGQLTNNGNLQVHTGGAMAISGIFTNTNAAALRNNGTLYLKGKVVNNQPSMPGGTGAVHFNGTAVQALSGTQPFNVFNLTTNNAAGITLNADLSVSGVHTFTSGLITTSVTPNFLSYEAGSSYTGAADSRHVMGRVKKTGTTAFNFPVGNGTLLRPIGITNLSATAVFDAAYSGTTTNAGNRELTLASVNSSEHWTLNKISGGTAQVVMNWDHTKVSFPNYIMNDIRTAQYSTEWRSTGGSASGSVTGTGTITSNALSTFGPMVIGSITAIVPVRFLNITAHRVAGANRIIWQTANEAALKHYELQRQQINGAFLTIAAINAANLHEPQEYRYDDAALLTGKIYYRIKSVDRDGTAAYSKIVSVQIDNGSSIIVLQNPVKENIQLLAKDVKKGNYNYQIISAGGQVVQSGQIAMEGTQKLSIPFSGAAGNYLLSLSSGNETPSLLRIIKQ